ncbi:hypothetical protein [Mucilaginibacter sp.]|uniref:hypothetical protein n=1 Tax=Mucilaginibacter sp. TaxID=1882438 RepID=UPI00262CA1D7|nr:hypothetical protein [Mucilaginibacter sp.]MDB4919502.1 hypothetical protein [Mucilaginibacter sp.]
MENNQIKIRINLETREFEVHGEAKYINETFGTYISEYLDIIKGPQKTKNASNNDLLKNTEPLNNDKVSNDSALPDSFGEYLNRFPRTLSNVDKLLVSSFYVQSHNNGNFFTIPEASNLLIDQGVKLSNANAFNKSNESTKRIFKLSGKNFRVSDSGIQYIKTLV